MGSKTNYREMYQRLEREQGVQSEQLRLLSEVVRTANSILDPDSLMAYIMERVQLLVRSEAWSLLLLDESGEWLVFKEALGDRAQPLKESRIKLGEGVAGEVARSGRPLVVNDVKSSPYFNPEIDRVTRFKTRSILCVPLRSRGKTLGVLEVLNKQDNTDFSEMDLQTTLLFVEPCAIALENACLFQKVKQLSLVDDLTQLYNSRYLNQALEVEITRGRRYNYPVTVLFLDLDGFKGVNDRYGHLVGSETLRIVGRILKDLVRSVDIVARYGGDEFTIILPNTDLEAGKFVAERLRVGIVNHDFTAETACEFALSASFGIAGFPVHGDNPERLIQRADQAMYRVKETTKNDCAIFE